MIAGQGDINAMAALIQHLIAVRGFKIQQAYNLKKMSSYLEFLTKSAAAKGVSTGMFIAAAFKNSPIQ